MISISGTSFLIFSGLLWVSGRTFVISDGGDSTRLEVFESIDEARRKSETGRKGMARRPVRKKMYFKSSRSAIQIERARTPKDSILGTSHIRGIAMWSCCDARSVSKFMEQLLIGGVWYQLRSYSG